MKRGLSDSDEPQKQHGRQRKRLRTTINREFEYEDFRRGSCSDEIFNILRLEMPRARHLRLFARFSGLEIKWDEDKIIGEEHRNSLFLKNVPLPVMRQEKGPPLVEAVAEAATDLQDLFLIDSFNGSTNRYALKSFGSKGHWKSLEELSIWYFHYTTNHLGEFPIKSLPQFENLQRFALCGIELPTFSLRQLISKFPALRRLELHNRTSSRNTFPPPTRALFSDVFSAESLHLESLTISGMTWSNDEFVAKFLKDRPTLKMLEFDAANLTNDALAKVCRSLPETSVRELAISNLEQVVMAGTLVQSLVSRDCKLKKLKLIHPSSRSLNQLEERLTEALKSNTSLHSLTFARRGSNIPELQRTRDHYLKLNKVGRKYILEPGFKIGLWPNVLEQSNSELSVVHHLLRLKPDLVQDACSSC